jgi:hypothetical protein
MSFLQQAKASMKYALSQIKDDDHDGLLQIFERFQKVVIGGVLDGWKNRYTHAAFRRWLIADTEQKLSLLDQRATGVMMLDSTAVRTKEQTTDVLNFLKTWFNESLLLDELENIQSTCEHLSSSAGPLFDRQNSERIFQDSDPVKTLGLWLIIKGEVCLSRPTSEVVLSRGHKFTSNMLISLHPEFSNASDDTEFLCHVGSSARASGAEGCQVLFISRDAYNGSIGKLMVRRKEFNQRARTLQKCMLILMGKKYDSSEVANRLAEMAEVERLPRRATVCGRPNHFGILESGSLKVFSPKPSKQQIATIHEVGGIVFCNAQEASNTKKKKKRQFTTFAHDIIVVDSSESTIVWCPLSAANERVRTTLSNITEAQAIQRQSRANSSTSTLKGVHVAETERRRQRAADKLESANSQASNLSAHVAEFLDWKKKADEDMAFSDLDLSPARPSLTVVSPSKSRWSWSHNQRDLKGDTGSTSTTTKISKYAYSGRNTMN